MVEDARIIEIFSKAQQDLVLQSSDLSLRTVTSMVESGAVDIKPQFQRRDRWSVKKQAALIESFVLNIPVPPIYLAEDELGTYSVIDGKQRITAISSFLTGSLELRFLEKFPELEGKSFGQLPRLMQHSLDFRPLRAITLLKQSDQDLKYEVFHRLNTGGEVLNPQEIRNVVYRGPLNRLIYKLAEDRFLRQQLKITSDRASAYRNMTDAEYVLRYLTLEDSWQSFSGDLSRSMTKFMERNRVLSEDKLKELSNKFIRAVAACRDIWGDAAFKRPEGNSWRDQALAGMYDAQMIAVTELTDNDISTVVQERELAADAIRELFTDPKFDEAVRQGTNTPSRVQYRITRLNEMLRTIHS
jgi:hypothetical protein